MVANTPIECTLDRNHPAFNRTLLDSRAVVRFYADYEQAGYVL